MNQDEEKMLQDWFRKRRLTTIAGIAQKCIFSFEYSCVAISALYYFTYTFKVADAKLLYSVTMAVMYFASTLTAMFVGKYMDRTRNLRRIASSAVILSIVGNIIYMLPFSIGFPIVARALCGIADGVQPALSGEFSRCYTKKDLGKILSYYHILALFCYAIAPCSPVLFKNIDFHIGSLKVNQYNFIGLFLAIVLLFYSFFSYFLVTDLTKEPGYKLFLKMVECNSSKQCEESNENQDHTEEMWTLKHTFKDAMILIILLSDSVLGYLYAQLDIVMNMIALYNFSWDINHLGLFTFIGVSIISCLMIVFLRNLTSCVSYYFLFVSCFLFAWMELALMMYAIHFNASMFALQVFLFESFLFLNIVYGYGSAVYVKWVLYSIVPQHSRSFVESQRYIAAKSGSCFGFFTAAYVYSNNFVFMTSFCFVCFGFAILLQWKKNSYFSKLGKMEYQ